MLNEVKIQASLHRPQFYLSARVLIVCQSDVPGGRHWLERVVCSPLSVCFIAGCSAQMLEAFIMNPVFVIRYRVYDLECIQL